MYGTLLLLHSLVRYFVLIFLIVLIVKSFTGWQGKKEFTGADNKISLFTLIFTHIQFLLGLILYFVSPFVVFGGERDATSRYWTMEHISMMLIAVALITVARSTSKRMSDANAKHKRLFILNTVALVIIIAAIFMAKRGFFSLPI